MKSKTFSFIKNNLKIIFGKKEKKKKACTEDMVKFLLNRNTSLV